MDQPIKRLYRCDAEARLGGVCSGLGFYFRVDPVVVRLLWVAITCLSGVVPGLLAYLVAWIIMPLQPMPATVAEPPAAEPQAGPA